jgi:meso-butanediol dehydrogenase / (S,S)-butanediol dehydrogenase / diacetyl reductase
MSAEEGAPRVAFVTGAASGIGLAVARRLAGPGARLGLFDRDREKLAAAVAAIRDDGADAVEFPGDATDDEEVGDALRRFEIEAGQIGAVVACAGTWAPGAVEALTADAWESAMALNAKSVFLAARHAVPALRRSGGGSFVAIASDAGLRGFRECAAYVAGKHAVVGLVRAMALDHGPDGIRSNAICPGFVETPMLERIFEESRPAAREARQAQIPLGRFATPAEVADLISFLLSDQGAYLNGQALSLDGGAGVGQF